MSLQLGIRFFVVAIYAILPFSAALAEENSKQEEKQPLWWQTLEYFAQGADQSTSPAPDLIPYDTIKDLLNEHIVRPTQMGFDGPKGSEFNMPYYQTPESVQRWRRDELMQSIKTDRRTSYPVFLEDLDSVPHHPNRLGGSDVAPTGNWRPIKGLTFLEIAGPIIKEQLDPDQHIGGIKILDTAQAIQHLIDCQEKGKSAEECFKDYSINFAMSKAIMEALAIVGQKAGTRYLGNAALGEAIVGGTATIGYLAYADYLAIQEIRQLILIRGEKWSDEQENQLQSEINERDSLALWDGTLNQLRTRLELFEAQFAQKMEPASEKLFSSWGKADQCMSSLNNKRLALNTALDQFPIPSQLEAEIKEICEQALDDALGDKLLTLHLALEKKMKSMLETLNEAKLLASSCQTEADADTIRDMQKTLRELAKSAVEDLDQAKKISDSVSLSCDKAAADKKEDFIAQAEKAEDLKHAYQAFIKTYDQCIIYTARTAGDYSDFLNVRNVFRGRSKLLASFLRTRIKETLWGSDLEKSEELLSGFERRLANFKPKRMPYESIANYESFVKNSSGDLKQLESVPKKLKDSITQKISLLQSVEPNCEKTLSLGALEKFSDQLKSLQKEIDTLSKLADECAPVEVPKVIGLKLQEAIRRINARSLTPRPEQRKEPTTLEANAYLVIEQEPGCPKKVPRKSDIRFVHWGPFDAEAKCYELNLAFGTAIRNKQQDEAKRLLGELKRYKCKEASGAETEMQQLENMISRANKAQVPLVLNFPQAKAEDLVLKAGFKVDSRYSEEKPKEPRLFGTVKEQKPAGNTWHAKGETRVELSIWPGFDPSALEAETTCQKPKDSTPKYNEKTGKVDCVCTEYQVLASLKDNAAACLSCEQMEQYYKSALARGARERARNILALSKKCPWASGAENALNMQEAAEQRQDECDRQKKGSRLEPVGFGKFECRCPAKTVEAKKADGKLECIDCDKMKGYFDSAINRGALERAQEILKLSRLCNWSLDGQQTLAANSPEGKCSAQLAGSFPTPLGGGKYRCDCPAGTVALQTNGKQACTPCEQVLNLINAHFSGQRLMEAKNLIAASSQCPWYNQALQVAAQNEHNLMQQQQQNAMLCEQLQQQIQQLCAAQQWSSLPALYAQANNIPGCSLSSALVAACSIGQAAQIFQQQYSRPPQPGYNGFPPPPPGGFRPPVQPSGPQVSPPNLGAGGGKACYVVMIDSVSEAPAVLWYTKDYYCDCGLPADQSQLPAALQRMDQHRNRYLQSPNRASSRVISGPYSLRGAQYGSMTAAQKTCPPGSIPPRESRQVPK